MAEMKVYGGCYDGKNRVIVCAKSKKAAHVAVNSGWPISYYSYNEFTCDTGNDEELETALAAPGTVFSRPMVVRDAKFAACRATQKGERR